MGPILKSVMSTFLVVGFLFASQDLTKANAKKDRDISPSYSAGNGQLLKVRSARSSSVVTVRSMGFNGNGSLKDGEAYIPFPDAYAISDNAVITITVTPTSPCKGIEVVTTSPQGFLVKELHNGRSNASFTWTATIKETNSKSLLPFTKTTQKPGKKETVHQKRADQVTR